MRYSRVGQIAIMVETVISLWNASLSTPRHDERERERERERELMTALPSPGQTLLLYIVRLSRGWCQ